MTLHYRLSTADGKEVDSSFDGEPLTIRIGERTMAANLEKRLIGLMPGQRKIFRLPPEDAFGYSDPAQVQVLPKNQFPSDMTLRERTLIEFALPNGDCVSGTIIGHQADHVIVDFNHPLSDCAIVFEVDILAADTQLASETT